MKRSVFAFFAFLLAHSCLWGMTYTCPSFEVDIGYRHDNFDWSVAGPNGHPSILSELKWRGLNSLEILWKGTYLFDYNLFVKGNAGYTHAFNGEVRDSDYLADHRRKEFSRAYSKARNSFMYDVSGAVGFFFCALNGALEAIPLLGYSYHSQHLRMSRGHQLIAPIESLLGSIKGLDSSYKARWSGPWIGVDLNYRYNCDLSLLFSYEFHFAHYNANGDWNLRTDLPKGFHHNAEGNGNVVSLGANYQLCHHFFLGLNLQYKTWRTNHGKDKGLVQFVDNGNLICIHFKQRLNKVCWESCSILANLGYSF